MAGGSESSPRAQQPSVWGCIWSLNPHPPPSSQGLLGPALRPYPCTKVALPVVGCSQSPVSLMGLNTPLSSSRLAARTPSHGHCALATVGPQGLYPQALLPFGIRICPAPGSLSVCPLISGGTRGGRVEREIEEVCGGGGCGGERESKRERERGNR